MNFWWVNQNQTFRQETEGGYLWSPKKRNNGSREPSYEFMRELAAGDLVFSSAAQVIQGIFVVQRPAFEAPKPDEFGSAGDVWADIGWRVPCKFLTFENKPAFRPQAEILLPLQPTRYGPLNRDGSAKQGYLFKVPFRMAEALCELIGLRAMELMRFQPAVADEDYEAEDPVDEWERRLEKVISSQDEIPETDRESVIVSRVGQGQFRRNVASIERRCRVTRVEREEFLIASHIKPWRHSDNAERLDGSNGLLLTPTIDRLFDRGYISFSHEGELMISPVAHLQSLERMGVPIDEVEDVGSFSEQQQAYLQFHHTDIFRKANL